MCKARRDPGKGVGGLRVQPLSGASLKTRGLLGSVVLQAAGLLLGASSVLKRIRTPTRALGARILGLQEEGRGLGLGRWGVSAHYLHLSKRLIATALGHAWRRSCHVSFTRSGRGFFPPKTPPLPLGCPRAPPSPIKVGPRRPRIRPIGKCWTEDRCQVQERVEHPK